MKWILWTVQFIVFALFAVAWIGENLSDYDDPKNKKWRMFSRQCTISLYSIFLAVYIGVLIVLTRRLIQHFPKFYSQEKFKIFGATGAIILAIICRIGLNIWYIYNVDTIDDSYNHNTWLFPIYQLVSGILASIFPLAATIISLLYALN